MANIFLTICVCLLLGLSECQAGENDIPGSEWSESPAENYDSQSLKQVQASDVSKLNATSEPDCDKAIYLLWKQLGVLEERLNVTVEDLEEKLSDNERKLAALNNIVTEGQRDVAFSATRPVMSGNIAAGHADMALVYAQVLSNVGNAYNPGTGYFIAPVNGVYFFSFTSYFWASSGSTGGSLYQNGQKVVSWYGFSKVQDISQSNSAVLQLRAGDAVNVRVWAGYQIGDNGNRYCSFNGFLLFSM